MTSRTVTTDIIQRGGMVQLRDGGCAAAVTGFTIRTVQADVSMARSTVIGGISWLDMMIGTLTVTISTDNSLGLGTDMTCRAETSLIGRSCMVRTCNRTTASMACAAVILNDCRVGVTGRALPGGTGNRQVVVH